MHRRLTYSNVVSTLALFLALMGGTAYAASKITGKQIAKNTITSDNVKTRSLLSSDFKLGQLPAGPSGPAGPMGAQGPQGPAGSAKAYAVITRPAANRAPEFYSNTGFPEDGVTSPSTGIYCIKPPAGYKARDSYALSANGFGFVIAWNPQQCGGGNNIEVGTYDTDGNPTALLPFHIVVP